MEFITLEMLLSLAGCVVVVGIITQALKMYFKNINALWLNFFTSLVIGVIRIFVVGDFTAAGIITGILNIFVIMLAAGGGYDTVKSLISNFTTKEEEVKKTTKKKK